MDKAVGVSPTPPKARISDDHGYSRQGILTLAESGLQAAACGCMLCVRASAVQNMTCPGLDDQERFSICLFMFRAGLAAPESKCSLRDCRDLVNASLAGCQGSELFDKEREKE